MMTTIFRCGLICTLLTGITLDTWSEPSRGEADESHEVITRITTSRGEHIHITAQDFLHAWRARALAEPSLRDTPAARRATLEQLIDLYILANEAEGRVEQADHSAEALRDQLAARAYLEHDFEARLQAYNLPKRYVQDSKRQNIGMFRHPELRRGVHLLFKPRGTSLSPMTATQAQALKPYVARAVDEMRREPVRSAESLKSRVERYQAWLSDEYEVIFENLGRFALKGRFHEGFTEACFKITTAQTLSSPIETPFGYHFVWIEEIIPPLDTPDEEIDRVVRQKLLPSVRTHEWRQLMYELQRRSERSARE